MSLVPFMLVEQCPTFIRPLPHILVPVEHLPHTTWPFHCSLFKCFNCVNCIICFYVGFSIWCGFKEDFFALGCPWDNDPVLAVLGLPKMALHGNRNSETTFHYKTPKKDTSVTKKWFLAILGPHPTVHSGPGWNMLPSMHPSFMYCFPRNLCIM